MRILLRRGGGQWQPAESHGYASEEDLQKLLKHSPEIIPRDPPDLASVVYCREFPLGSCFVDLVGVGSDGSVSLIECKLAKSHEAKRTVVGQVLEYASLLWRMGLTDFEEAFASRSGQSPFDELRDANPDEWDEAACREALAENLGRGRFRLLIVVDHVSPELRGIIEYVNARPGELRLVALELPYFTTQNIEVLVPETYGDELKTRASTCRQRIPTVEEHLAAHPEAWDLHAKIVSTLPDHHTTRHGISYRDPAGKRAVLMLYMPERRIYFLKDGIPDADVESMITAAQRLGLRTTRTSIEWPDGALMSGLLRLLDDHILPFFGRRRT